MRTLILVEHQDGVIHPSIRQVVTAAQHFGADISALVLGYQCSAVVEQATKIAGIQHVYCVEHDAFQHQLAEVVSRFVADWAHSFDVLLATASTFGKNCLPRIAALWNVGQVSDITRIIDQETFERPVYAGNAIETLKVLDHKKVLTIRATTFEANLAEQVPCPVTWLTAPSLSPRQAQFIRQQLTHSTRPDLMNAKIIVAGGRGLQNAENFKLIEALADVLGAAVGASRAAVDAGFISNDYQVGQTGKVVAPTLYIAIGISGAIQHIAGMKDSKIIVAINKDPDAPIFQIATYGLVGDLFEIVPELMTALQNKE